MVKMSLEEKRSVLDAFCDSYTDCDTCPMGDDSHAWCMTCCSKDNITEEQADRDIAKYNILGESNVDHPSHYNQGNIECIDAMVAAFGKEDVEIFCRLNAFKYIWRAKHKNGKEDLKKAQWYLNKRLELSSSE